MSACSLVWNKSSTGHHFPMENSRHNAGSTADVKIYK